LKNCAKQTDDIDKSVIEKVLRGEKEWSWISLLINSFLKTAPDGPLWWTGIVCHLCHNGSFLSSDWGKLIDLGVGDAGALVLVHHLHSVRPGQSDHRLEDASQWAWRLPLLAPLVLKDVGLFLAGADGGDSQPRPVLLEGPGLRVRVGLEQLQQRGVHPPDFKVLVHPGQRAIIRTFLVPKTAIDEVGVQDMAPNEVDK